MAIISKRAFPLVGPAAWTPIDLSGASLSFTVAGASYYQVGKLIVASFRLTFPVTVNGSTAAIGGLAGNSADIGTGSLYGGSSVWSTLASNGSLSAALTRGTGAFSFINGAGSVLTNANLSA